MGMIGKFTITEDPVNGMVTITRTCGYCHKDASITVTRVGWQMYLRGELIQNAFPDLTNGQREQILSGYHDACFDEMFREAEESEM